MQAVGPGLVGVIEQEGRTELADGRGAEALRARQLQHGLFVHVIAAEMLVDIEQNRLTSMNGVTVSLEWATG